jgi:hypothetical protein
MIRNAKEIAESYSFELMQEENEYLFELMRLFVFASTDMIIDGNKKLKKKVESWDKKHPNPWIWGKDFHENEYLKLNTFEENIDAAILIIVYSRFEVLFQKICFIMKERAKLELSPRDINGTGIQQSRKYLEKMFKIDFKSVEDKWTNITTWQYLRNRIVHENGYIVPKEGTKISDIKECKYAMKNHMAFIDDNNFITLSSLNIHKFIDDAEGLLKYIIILCQESE